ncbi:hypothetical protein [Agromyces seonyuensis]|uniref:Uncharacterized protein n=1 Tax=Agromyces seonyuensis TaxID=2662446 RepID=A0A6I4P6A0_9MICO|nr:hypothetical protein [Agromyces seonyuensis]MWB99124.1 hypothetical protein [Agromyces seonyuensis]
MTATTTLTDRYLFAASRVLPAGQRAEFERDLAERIADGIDARLEEGTSTPETAERDALVDLGHPAVLAARYADHPATLIGPRVYFIWKRLLIFLECLVPPIVAAAVLLGMLIAGEGWGAIGPTIGVTISVAVQLAFWVTLVFAFIDRTPGEPTDLLAWTPEQLPQLPDVRRPNRLTDLIASLVWLAIAAAFVIWQQFGLPWIGHELGSIPMLNPDLWSFWLPYLLGLLVLEAGFAYWIYRSDWTWPAAAVNVVLNAAFAVPAIWLIATGDLLNPEFARTFLDLVDANADEVFASTGAVAIVVIVGLCIWDAIDGIVKAARGGGRGTLEFPGNRSRRRVAG